MPFCGNCGRELPNNAAFCTHCGEPVIAASAAAVQETAAHRPAPAKRKRGGRAWWIILLCVAVVLGLTAGALFLTRVRGGKPATRPAAAAAADTPLPVTPLPTVTPTATPTATPTPTPTATPTPPPPRLHADGLCLYHTSDGFTILCDYNGNTSTYETAWEYSCSEDHRTYCMLEGKKRLLHLVTADGGSEQLAKNADYGAVSFDGRYVIYIERISETEYRLLQYEIATRQTTQLDAVSDGVMYLPVVSPNGRTVAYCVWTYEQGEELRIIRDGGTPDFVRADTVPIGVSDDGDYLYYADEVGQDVTRRALFVEHNGTRTALGSIEDYKGDVIFNADLSEMIYYAEGASYITCGGQAGVRFTDGSAYLGADNYQSWSNIPYAVTVAFQEAVPSFLGRLFLAEDLTTGIESAVYLSADLTGRKIASGVDSYVLSESQNAVMYLRNGEVYLQSDLSGAAEPTCVYADSTVFDMDAPRSLSHLYVLTSSNVLYRVALTGETTAVAQDVYSMAVSRETGECSYVTNSGKLFRHTDTGTEQMFFTEDVSYFFYGADDVLCCGAKSLTVAKAFDLYRVMDGGGLLLLTEGVE